MPRTRIAFRVSGSVEFMFAECPTFFCASFWSPVPLFVVLCLFLVLFLVVCSCCWFRWALFFVVFGYVRLSQIVFGVFLRLLGHFQGEVGLFGLQLGRFVYVYVCVYAYVNVYVSESVCV